MPELHIEPLAEPLWPLLNKFYRHHDSSMKALKGGRLWVARDGEIVAGLVTMRFFYRHELVKREYKLSRTAFAPTLFSTGCVLLYLANRGFGYTSETWIWPAEGPRPQA